MRSTSPDDIPTRSSDQGMVLIAVIWLLALLGGLTMAMSLFTANVLSAVDVYRDRPRAAAAIAGGLNLAAAALMADDKQPPGTTTVAIGDARVSASWVDETARIDINMAPAELLGGLFTQLGAESNAATGYAGLLVGLRGTPANAPAATPGQPVGYDPNEETPAAIAAAARGDQPKADEPDPHKPFVDAVQVLQVPGLPASLMARALPYLTTFSGVAQIDPRLAAPAVIRALPGMTRERIRTLMAVRDQGGDEAALSDALDEAKPFTTTKRAAATRVAVTAVLPDGFTTSAEIVIVHYPDDKVPYRVLSWDDGVDVRKPPVRGALP